MIGPGYEAGIMVRHLYPGVSAEGIQIDRL
jgi:hypothetical protein